MANRISILITVLLVLTIMQALGAAAVPDFKIDKVQQIGTEVIIAPFPVQGGFLYDIKDGDTIALSAPGVFLGSAASFLVTVRNAGDGGTMYVEGMINRRDTINSWYAGTSSLPFAIASQTASQKLNCVSGEPHVQTAVVNLASGASTTVRYDLSLENVYTNEITLPSEEFGVLFQAFRSCYKDVKDSTRDTGITSWRGIKVKLDEAAIGIHPQNKAATCSDRIKNNDESDIDCGGPQCLASDIHKRCQDYNKCDDESGNPSGANCISGICGVKAGSTNKNNVCQPKPVEVVNETKVVEFVNGNGDKGLNNNQSPNDQELVFPGQEKLNAFLNQYGYLLLIGGGVLLLLIGMKKKGRR